MNKLMPLLAVAVTACGPALHDNELREIPGLGLYVPYSYSRTADTMSVALSYDWSRGGDCYRIPADTRLTLNGEAATLDRRGDARLGFDGASSCEYPRSSSRMGARGCARCSRSSARPGASV